MVATTLKHAIVNHQISHAYLFSGPRGTGKTSAAKIFAKAINCPNQVDGEPCNNCFICDAITKGSLEDVIELDAASNNGVDEIREIRDKSTYAASTATYKVYIIDEVHMLSTGAFNALLKTLEEPTDNVVFVLATTELQKIPATIISRVQRFAFKAITTSDIRGHLAEVLADEAIDYEPEALDVIAKSAEGGMRDALSLLDQALSFSDGKLRQKDALLVTGSIASEALISYVNALAQADEKAALAALDATFAEGKNMLRFTEDLLAYLRDLLLDTAANISRGQLFAWIDIAIDSLKTIRETTQTKIAADVMTMRLAESARTFTGSALENPSAVTENSGQTNNLQSLQNELRQLKQEVIQLKNQLSAASTGSVTALPNLSAVTENSSALTEHFGAENPTFEATAGKVSRDLLFKVLSEATRDALTSVQNAWPELVASMTKPAEHALLNNTKPAAASQHFVIVTFPHENLAKRVRENQEMQQTCGQLLSSICGFAPEIIALSSDEWQATRADYVQSLKADQPLNQAESEPEPQPENEALSLAKSLFGDKVSEVED